MDHTMADAITLHLRDANRRMLINANHRSHWARRAARTAYWRQLAAWNANLHGRLRGADYTHVHVTVTITWPERRRRDPANWAPTAKAIVDGLVDAGVVADDDAGHVTGPDMRTATGPFGVRVDITPTDGAPC